MCSEFSLLEASKTVRYNLATAYHILAKLNLDDLTYTHLSARVPGKDSFYIHPLGMLFEEVTAENLLQVSCDGDVLEGVEQSPNQTGFVIHSSIYKARPDIQAIFHLHTSAGVAVSAMREGLMPLSQFSFHFYNRMAYHRYDALALNKDHHGKRLVTDLGEHNNMILENHGTISCGGTIHQAMFYAYYLEQACRVQVMAMGASKNVIMPPQEVCEQAAKDMRNFELDLGYRDWIALKRKYKL